MNQLVDLPPEYDAGLEFDYSVWTANTEVTLVNVGWNNDYRDVVSYKGKDELDRYLLSRPHQTIKWLSRAKISRPIRLQVPYTTVMKYNYIAVRNGAYPTGGTDQRFYYFITDVNDVAPDTTEIVVQLDVWQTFLYDIEVKSGYVERGHVGIANQNSYDHHGRTYLTAPEGLDVGGEYNICYTAVDRILDVSYSSTYDILVLSSVDLTASPMEGNNLNLETAKPARNQNLPSGLGLYMFKNSTELEGWLRAMAKYPHMTRGIIGMWVVPDIEDICDDVQLDESTVGAYSIYRVVNLRINNKKITMLNNWRQYVDMNIPAKYKHLLKFYTFPYCAIELTSHTGAPLLLKPESLDSDAIRVTRMVSLVPPSPRIGWVPWKYNSVDSESDNYETNAYGSINDDGCEWDDMLASISNFPSLGVVNDGYMDYLNSNKNSIAQAYQSADWSQQKALQGNQLAYNQSQAGQDLFNQQAQIQRNTINSSANLAYDMSDMSARQGMVNAVGGALQSLGSGSLPGAVAGVAGNVMQGANVIMSRDIANAQTAGSSHIQRQALAANTAAINANTNYVRDTNKDYADFAAKGDYQNSINAIQAKVQDAKLIQPSVSGQIGGDAFLLATSYWRLTAKIKIVNEGVIRMVGDFWLRYGYAINRWVSNIPKDLMVMSKFTYWKMHETYLSTATCPESYKQAIRGILEKGVTIWADADDIGTVDRTDNVPVGGVYY